MNHVGLKVKFANHQKPGTFDVIGERYHEPSCTLFLYLAQFPDEHFPANMFTIVKEKPPVNIHFTQEELRTLYIIFRKIGGEPGNSPRQYVNSMMKKISKYVQKEGFGAIHSVSGTINFDPGELPENIKFIEDSDKSQ